MSRSFVLRIAHFMLAVAIVGAVGYAATSWMRLSYESDIELRIRNSLYLWTDAGTKLCIALMLYGLIRSLGGSTRAKWLAWTAAAAALFIDLYREILLFSNDRYEWVVLPPILLNVAIVGMVFLSVWLFTRGIHPPPPGDDRDSDHPTTND